MYWTLEELKKAEKEYDRKVKQDYYDYLCRLKEEDDLDSK